MPQWDENGRLIEEAESQPRRQRREWDENGREVSASPAPRANVRQAPRVNATEDVVRSFGTGVEEGVAGLIGLPRDVAELHPQIVAWGGRALTNIGRQVRGEEPIEWTDAARDATVNAARRMDRIVDPVGGTAREGVRRLLPSSVEASQAIDEATLWERHEPQTTAGEYARTAGQFAPGALFPAGNARTVAGQVVARLGANVAAPAVASEAAGQLTDGSDYEPVARVGGAILGGVGANAALQTASRGGLTPGDRAVRMIDRRLRQGGTNIDEVDSTARALRRQGGDTAETIAEVGGQPLQRAARAVANVDGDGQGIAATYLEERTAGTSGRLLSEVTRSTAPQQTRAPRNFYDAQESLRAARSGQGAEAYRLAHAQTVDQAVVRDDLLPIMQRGPAAAVDGALEQLQSSALRSQSELLLARRANNAQAIQQWQDDIAGIEDAMSQLRAIKAGQMPNAVSVRALDYYQRGLGQMAANAGYRTPQGSAWEGARDAFNRVADELAPAYAQARQNYGASIRIEELMADGRRVFNMPEGEIELLLRGRNGAGLTTEEFDGFMLGVMDALETKIRAGDTAFVARFMRNQNWQAQLERAFTPNPEAARRALEAARRKSGSTRAISQNDIRAQQQRMARQASQRLRNRIAREASMRRFDNAVRSGSQTTPMAEDIKALTQGESELGFLSEVIQGGGNVRGPVIRALARAWDRIHRPGIYNPEVNRELAKRLFQPATTGNVRQLRQEIAALRKRGITISAPVERDLVRAAMLARDGDRFDEAAADRPLEERAADYSDADLERIAAGAN